jgi:hypothetical protein
MHRYAWQERMERRSRLDRHLHPATRSVTPTTSRSTAGAARRNFRRHAADPPLSVDLAALGLGMRIADGGQGAVFDPVSGLDPALTANGPVVVKLYARPVQAAALLEERIAWARALDGPARRDLYAVAAWPLALIRQGTSTAGIVMADMRPRFMASMTKPSGGSANVLLRLEHALEDDAYLKRRFGIDADTSTRALVAEVLAGALAVLHRHGIVASDFSHANLLLRLSAPPAAAFIDCDSMVFQGKLALRTVETPGWQITSSYNEIATTRTADLYKLGLAILRVFARSQSAEYSPANIAHVPTPLRPLLTKALDGKPSGRPSAAEWQLALRTLHGKPLARQYPGPTSRTATGAAPAAPRATPIPPLPPQAIPPASPVHMPAQTPPPQQSPTPPRPSPTVTGPGAARPPIAPTVWRWLRRVVALVLVIGVISGLASIGNITRSGSGGSSSSAGSTPSADDPNASDSGSPADGSPPPAPADGPAQTIRRHFERLGDGDYRGAFKLFTRSYRRKTPSWLSLRTEAAPTIKLTKVGSPVVNGNTAIVSVRFYAQDQYEVRDSDTQCRLFSGTAFMRRVEGHWRYAPRQHDLDAQIVNSSRCSP